MNDGKQGFLQPGWAKPDLVAALAVCLGEWQRILAAPALARDAELSRLIQCSQALEAPLRGVGFGGVAHHLSELSTLAQGSADISRVREQLGVVQELLASARATLSPEEAGKARDSGAAAPPALVSPPPLLSGQIRIAQSDAPSSAAVMIAPPRFLTSPGQSPSPLSPVAKAEPAAPPAAPQRPMPVSAPPRVPVALPAASDAAVSPPLSAHVPVPAVLSRPGQPNLHVRSVLGLRAFGRKESTPGPAKPPAPAPAGDSSSVLGLQRRSSPPAAPLPPSLGDGYGGLPPLQHLPGGGLPPLLDELGGGRKSVPLAPTPPRLHRGGRARPRQRGQSGGNRWWTGALAALGGVCVVVLGIVLSIVTLARRREESIANAGTANATPSGSAVGTGASPGDDSGLPRSRLLTDDERFRSLLTQVHGRGKESGELRALLEEQAAVAAQALQPGCTGPACATLESIGKLVTATGKKRVKRRARAPDALRSRWLAGLEMPDLPVEDDPRVRKHFEFYTENPVGRETFQQMLFRCGAYKDAIQSALIRRGLPKDLIAVAYAESSCYPLAKSPVGAEGLWQFIPDAARAYHLRVIDGVVDERHSPQKSTDAAIQYYSDLYAKFGSWDLAFSAYNVGPFGLAARLARVEGDDVGFWELVDAEMLPDETADYAPAIQAIALILNNLQRLKFGSIQQRAPQMTMDLQVPPATRLTLVARAAALSLDQLRRLNLDIKGTSTPAVPNFAVQVPKDSVWQARDTLQELLRSGDQSDTCAPANFDWGAQRFTTEMQAACARTLGARAAEAAAAPSAGR